MTLVVTMKMIKRTRKMSVSGVMLISATMPSLPSSSPLGRERAAMPNLRRLLVLEGRARGLDVEQRLHEPLAGTREQAGDRDVAHLQPVVRGERDDRDEQTRGGRDQRLRNARGHDGEAAGA